LKSKGKKICIVASSLGKGGAERSSALLSIMLSNLGYDIYIVTVLDAVEYAYNGQLFNLGAIKKQNDSFFGRIGRLKKFKHFLKTNQIDVVIDNRSRVQTYREIIVTKFIYTVPTIYVIHNFNTEKAFTKYHWINKWLYQNEYMTAVSEAATEKFKNLYALHKIRTIYNGFDFEQIKRLAQENIETEVPEKFMLFFGRIDDHHKNLKLLIEAYSLSDLSHQNFKLLILGNGPDLDMIKAYAETLGVAHSVMFIGHVLNPYSYVKRAKFTVLTSRFEGFPMVIPESLSLGIPVISVDCQSGPNEVIINNHNGLLVENYQPQTLADAFNRFILNEELYNKCAKNAVESVEQFSIESISACWEKLLNDMI
jgi:glycosyltransferase involved in cell wall biosynthesis